MPVRMGLVRYGNRNRPFYRIQVQDTRRAPRKKFIEQVGTFDPIQNAHKQKDLRLNVFRTKYWLSVGVVPTPAVEQLLYRFNILPKPPRKMPIVGTKLDASLLRFGPPPDYEAYARNMAAAAQKAEEAAAAAAAKFEAYHDKRQEKMLLLNPEDLKAYGNEPQPEDFPEDAEAEVEAETEGAEGESEAGASEGGES